VTYVTQHGSEFNNLPRTDCSQREARINASGFAHQLPGNHHVQSLAEIVLMKDDVACYELNAFCRSIQQVADRWRTRQQLRNRSRRSSIAPI
jgi:hypothetical protein